MFIYIDSNFGCHMENDGSMRQIETDFFDGKCREFIEGYRFVPDGESWTRSDGAVFQGEMIAPATDYNRLAEIQAAVDGNDAIRDAELAALIEEIYQEDLEVINDV